MAYKSIFDTGKSNNNENEYIAQNSYFPTKQSNGGHRSIFDTYTPDPNYYTNKTINDSTKSLLSNKLNIPEPDVAKEPSRAWYEKYIFDPISSLSYGLARGTKNIADDDKNTTFMQGAMEGLKSGFDDNRAEQRTSWKEVLDTLLSSQNETKKNTTATINNLLNPLAWEDIIHGKDTVQTAKAHTGLTGFAGDVLLDPANLLGGIGEAGKLLSKGSKGIEAIKDVGKFGDINKATDVLSKIQEVVKPEEAQYLLDKTKKAMGMMEDYKGITLGTKNHNLTLVSPETIAKLGKTIPFEVLNKTLEVLKNSDTAKGIGKLFGGGKYGDLLREAKANPNIAMENIAQIDSLKLLENLRKKGYLDVGEEARKYQKTFDGHNDEIVNAWEQGDTYKQVPNGTVDEQIINPQREEAFNNYRTELQQKRNQAEAYLDELKKEKQNAPIKHQEEIQKKIDEVNNMLSQAETELQSVSKNSLEVPTNNLSNEATIGIANEVQTPVEPLNGVIKPVQNDTRTTLEKIHELDAKLGNKPTKFVDGTTEEQMSKVLENRVKKLNEGVKIEPSSIERPKKSIENTMKELTDNFGQTIPEEQLARLTKAHEVLNLPLTPEILNRYKSLGKEEALQEIKFLQKKYLNRQEFVKNTEAYNKVLTELSERAGVKPRYDISSKLFEENNIGFQAIEKARMNRILAEQKGNKIAKVLLNKNTSEAKAISLADKLVNAFPNAKWIREAGDDLTRDIKYMTNAEISQLERVIANAKNKPYESKLHPSSWKTENKVFSNDINNSLKEGYKEHNPNATLDEINKWASEDVISNNNSNVLDDLKIDKQLDRATDGQVEAIAKIVSKLKEYNPIAYQDIKKVMGGNFRNLTQLKVDTFFNELKKYNKPEYVKAKVEPVVEASKKALKENKVIEINPIAKQNETKDIINTVAETPKEQLVAVTKDSPDVSQKLQEIKDITETFNNKQLQLDTKIKNMERHIEVLNNSIQNPETRLKSFEREYDDKFPEYITVQKNVYKNEKVASAFDKLPDDVKVSAEQMREAFKQFGIDEGLITKEQSEGLYTYLTHVLNHDYRDKQEYLDLLNKELKNPNNKHAKERTIDGTIKEINDMMFEKHGIKDFFETNLVRIYAERSIAHNQYMFDKKLVENTVNLYGKKFDFTGLKEVGDEAYTKAKKEFDDLYNSGEYSIIRLEDKFTPVDVLALNGKSKEEAQNLFKNHMPFSEVNINDLEKRTLMEYKDQPLYLVPKQAHANYLKIAQGQFTHETNGLVKAFDKFMGFWKASALFSSSFHINNMVGNTFNSYLSIGGKILEPKLNIDALRILNGKETSVIRGKTVKEWNDLLHEFGVRDRDYMNTELGAFRKKETDNVLGNDSVLTKMVKKYNPYAVSHIIGDKIESQARIVNFLAHLEDGKTPQEASDLVNKFLFDYSDLTDFEQNTMKRIVPFYTWLRKNVPLQLEQMFNNPTKYGKIYRGTKEASEKETDEQKALRPDYLKNAIYRSNNKYLSLNLPYQDLDKITSPKEMFSSANPLGKLAIELMANKNVYFDSPIAQRDGDMSKAPSYANLIAQDTPNGKMMDAKLRYALKSLLPSVEKASNLYDVASGNGGNSESADSFLKGTKTTTVDFDKLKEEALKKYAEKLTGTVANNTEQGYIKKKNTKSNRRSIFDK